MKFSVLLTIVFFIHSLSTYQNYKVIFLNIWYKKLLRGIGWAFVSLLLDVSFWQIDLLKRPYDLLATGSLRATIFVRCWKANNSKKKLYWQALYQKNTLSKVNISSRKVWKVIIYSTHFLNFTDFYFCNSQIEGHFVDN